MKMIQISRINNYIGDSYYLSDMATKILPFAEFQTAFDPTHNELSTYYRVRVAEPITSSYGVAQYVRDVIDSAGNIKL